MSVDRYTPQNIQFESASISNGSRGDVICRIQVRIMSKTGESLGREMIQVQLPQGIRNALEAFVMQEINKAGQEFELDTPGQILNDAGN